jgi:hypothetical protein
MKRAALIIISVIFLLSACALEIANVIGPGGGYVFDDKGNYKGGWRYKECSSFDIGELKDLSDASLKKAVELCKDKSDEWYAFEWELPDEDDLKKILNCFSYGLTRFSPDYYYLAVNKPVGYDENDTDTWEVVVLHKNFDVKMNGEVEKVETFPDVVKIRPIRKF